MLHLSLFDTSKSVSVTACMSMCAHVSHMYIENYRIHSSEHIIRKKNLAHHQTYKSTLKYQAFKNYLLTYTLTCIFGQHVEKTRKANIPKEKIYKVRCLHRQVRHSGVFFSVPLQKCQSMRKKNVWKITPCGKLQFQAVECLWKHRSFAGALFIKIYPFCSNFSHLLERDYLLLPTWHDAISVFPWKHSAYRQRMH